MGLLLFRVSLVINAFNIATENPVTTKPYRFPVYPVNECPRSKDEFKTAAQRRNCTKGLRYLCAPNKYLSSLIEFCTNRQISLYQEGNCVILEGTGDLDHYSCVEKFNSSCPLEFYSDEEIYKYPACLEIDRELRCFAADNGCKKREFHTTESNLNISKMETVGDETFRGASRGWIAIGYIIATAAVLAVIILSWIIFQKRKRDSEPPIDQASDNMSKSIQIDEEQKKESEIDDDKLRQFLSKGEISVCHVRCIIVGCGKAGKTTLLKRLQNASFDELMQIEQTEMVDFHVNSFEVLTEEETIQSIEKEDTVPTILFSKEKLEMPLKENEVKMAEEAQQPRIEKEDTVPTNLSSKKNLEMQLKENEVKMAEEAQQPTVSEKDQIENTPMDKLNQENEKIVKPHIQDPKPVQPPIFPGEDIDAIVDQNGFEQYAISKIKDAVNELLNETDLRPQITFLDFAGQSMYYAFHQIFLRPKSCSILVMDMTKGFNDEVGVQDENEKECSQFASWKYSDYYKFWLRSIDVFSDTESPVIIVGTHADKLSEEGRRKFHENLFTFFNTWCQPDLQRHFNADRKYTIGFPVSGSEFEDLKGLKQCIAKIVNSPRYSSEKIRPVWALFEHILNIMKENKKVISRKTLADYIDQLTAQEFKIDESEISKMLDFFHRVGVLLYFDKDGLKENIILDIQWLLDAIKRIIEYPVSPEKPDIKRRLFYETGELDNVELDRIWNVEGKDFLKHKTTIIAYMQQLGLLMPLKELRPTYSSGYYFPSMNSKRFDKTGEKHSKSSILCFKFDDKKQLPINFFYGIVLKCSKLNNWSISREEKKDNICLYQNAALFSFREHYVVLCNCNFEIRVQVWALPEIYDGRLLKKIKHSVKDIIHDDDLSYEIGYKCRKDVLDDEKDVSFNSQIIFPVSNYVCKTCDVEKNHVVENDICWELEVNENKAPSKKTQKADKPLKEGLPFDCTYRISIGKEEHKEEKAIENVEENFPLIMEDDKRSSSTIRPLKYAKISKSLDVPPATSPESKIVVAIDFGTTYSGFAYAITKYSEIFIQKRDPMAADKVDASLKTPTSLLLDDKNNFVAFGYDAEKIYKEYADDDRHEQIRFFQNFKMNLHRREMLESSMEIEDHLGKPLTAIDVFSKSLHYIKKVVLKELESAKADEGEGNLIAEENIHWIVTVPVIWDEYAKQFMREAAEKASIPSKQLTLALEPECAAIYVLTRAKLKLSSKQLEKTVCDPGEKYLVADLGGGKADFSVVEITENHTLKHLQYATGGDWGGKNVNKIIFNIYKEIFGSKVMKDFKNMKAELLEMENDIELKKRALKTKEKLSLKFSPTIAVLCQDAYSTSYKELLKKSRFKNYIELKGEKIIFAASIVDDIFKTVVGKIAEHMKLILKEPKADGIETVILVGGFARSDFVYEYIKKEISDKEVIIPNDPDLAVLKGAVSFGHSDGIIEMRVCDYTYGIESNRFPVTTDPRDKIKLIGGKHTCTQVFEKLVTIGDQVQVNSKVEKEVYASTENMTKMKVNIYRSKQTNPLFVTDKGCELFAEMTVEMPDIKEGIKRAAIISIDFGKTEIIFSGKDKSTDRGHRVSVDMIW